MLAEPALAEPALAEPASAPGEDSSKEAEASPSQPPKPDAAAPRPLPKSLYSRRRATVIQRQLHGDASAEFTDFLRVAKSRFEKLQCQERGLRRMATTIRDNMEAASEANMAPAFNQRDLDMIESRSGPLIAELHGLVHKVDSFLRQYETFVNVIQRIYATRQTALNAFERETGLLTEDAELRGWFVRIARQMKAQLHECSALVARGREDLEKRL